MPDFFFGAVARGAELEVRRRGAAFFVAPSEPLLVLPDDDFFAVVLEAVLFLGRLLEPVFFVVAIVIPPGVGCG
jgi:hypothetical protein